MDVTSFEIDEMSEGDEIDSLLEECGLYDGEGSPSTNVELASDILDTEVPLFSGSDGIQSTFKRRIGAKPDGGFEGIIATNDYSVEAEAETEALVISKLLAKYCIRQTD